MTWGMISPCCYLPNEDNKEKEIVRNNGVAGADKDVDRYRPTAFCPSPGMMSSKGREGICNEDDKDEAGVGHDVDNGTDVDGHLASKLTLVGKVPSRLEYNIALSLISIAPGKPSSVNGALKK